MKKIEKVVLHIPAREGSKRVPRKNMRLMCGEPMISYSIKAALDSKITKEVYVNTDSDEIVSYVEKYHKNCKIYHRDTKLASDDSSSDEFNFDIINKLNPDILVMINPVCPLIEHEDINQAFNQFKVSKCDTLISCSSTKMQTFCESKPVNIKIEEKLAPSQNNEEVSILNWAITIWDVNKFKQRMNNKGYAVLGDNLLFFNIGFFKGIKVSEEEDFLLAEKFIKIKKL